MTELVEALAKVLRSAGVETGYVGGEAFRRTVAQRMLADPGPLLDALAQAGVLETEHGEKRGEVSHDGGGCFSIHYDPYARLVSPWKPAGRQEVGHADPT